MEIDNTLNSNQIKNEHYCSNCGNYGHLFKNCNEPVNSYGLLCFYKKKTLVKDASISLHNKSSKTKKNEYSLKNNKHYKNHNLYDNLNKIKILKRNESITHTLKNMIGIVVSNTFEKKSVTDIIDETRENTNDEELTKRDYA